MQTHSTGGRLCASKGVSRFFLVLTPFYRFRYCVDSICDIEHLYINYFNITEGLSIIFQIITHRFNSSLFRVIILSKNK